MNTNCLRLFSPIFLFVFSVLPSYSQLRIVPHLTAPNGGFKTIVLIENPTMHPHAYTLQPFDSSGNALAEVVGTVAAYDSIQVNAVDMFPGSSVSHFICTEPDDGEFLTIRVSYSAASGRSSPAQVLELEEQKTRWRLFSGEWDTVFDGIAIVNTGTVSADIKLAQIGSDGQEIQSVTAISNLAPMAKGLYVIGGPSGSSFQAIDGSFFEVSSSVPMAITALRGTPPGSPVGYLWENEVDSTPGFTGSRIISHVTRSGGGFTSKFFFENRGTSNQQVELLPFDQSGTSLSPVTISIPANETRFQSASDVFGEEADSVSHFNISETSVNLRVSVSYRIATGQGSPAQLRESETAKSIWRIFPGNWDEIFDGFAAVNMGTIPSDVIVQQIDEHGDVIHAELALKNLAPMAKGLYVIGGPGGSQFQTVENSYFEIIGAEALALTVLRGTPPGAPIGYLWRNGSETNDDPLATLVGLESTASIQGGDLYGYLVQADTMLIIDSLEHAPQGSAAIPGMELTVSRIDGEVIATGTTDNEGRFAFSNLPPDLVQLRAASNGPAILHTARIVAFEATAAGAEVGFTRTDAYHLVMPDVTETDIVLCTAQPLPKDTNIRPLIQEEGIGGDEFVFILEHESWLFMVDSYAYEPFSHPVTYYLIHTETGALQKIEGITWAPLVNHHPIWVKDSDYLTYTEAIFDEEELLFTGTASPSVEVLQLPVLEEETSLDVDFSKAFEGTIEKEGVFILEIYGEKVAGHARVDEAKIKKFQKDNKIPASNIYQVKTTDYDTIIQGVKEMGVKIREINKKIAARLQQGKYSAIIVFITSHGDSIPVTKGTKTPRKGAFLLTDKHGNLNCLTAQQLTNLTLKGTEACRVNFILPICHAEYFSEDLYNIYASTEHDFLSIHASSKDKEAFTYKARRGKEIVFGGTKFIQKFIFNTSIEDGTIEGALVDGTLNPVLVNINEGAGFKQHVRTPSWCKTASGVSLTPDPALEPLNEGNLCEGNRDYLGLYWIYNPLRYAINLEGQASNPDVMLLFGMMSLAPGESTWVKFFNYAMRNAAFNFGINILSTNQNGGDQAVTTAGIQVQPGMDMLGFTMFFSTMLARKMVEVAWWNYVRSHAYLVLNTPQSIFMYLSNGHDGRNTGCALGTQQLITRFAYLSLALVTRLFGDGLNKIAEDPIYPCGQGSQGLTICAQNPLDAEEGDFIVITNVLQEPIDVADPDNYFQFGFVFDADGQAYNNYVPSSSYPMDFYKDTDRWYSAEYTPSGGWYLKVTDARNNNTTLIASAARVVINDHVVMLIVPKSEFSSPNPTYRVTSFRHTGDYGMTSGDWDGYMYPLLEEPLAPISELED